MTASHGEASDRRPMPPSAGERLDGDVGDAEEDAGGGAEHDAVVVVGRADARAA